MTNFDLTISKNIIQDSCKGKIYRYTESNYYKDGNIHQRKCLRLSKRLSCSGCEKCGWIDEELSEYLCNGAEFIINLKNGYLYKLMSHSIYEDDFEFKLEEYKEI